uniref:Uncharacterized protein n=1 Tax=Cucumis melo TaxID=3656 RepID=A0A9I9EBV8_CUCME
MSFVLILLGLLQPALLCLSGGSVPPRLDEVGENFKSRDLIRSFRVHWSTRGGTIPRHISYNHTLMSIYVLDLSLTGIFKSNDLKL